MNPLPLAAPGPILPAVPVLSPLVGTQHASVQQASRRDVCVPFSRQVSPACVAPVALPPLHGGVDETQERLFGPLQAACLAVRTSFLREPSAAEVRAAQEQPTDIPTRSADICTLGGALAHRRYQAYRKSGDALRAGICFAGSAVGHGLTLVTFPLTLSLAGAHYFGTRSLGRLGEGRTCSISEVRLDMAAADLLKMRHALRDVCCGVPAWAAGEGVSRALVLQHLQQAGQALEAMYENLSSDPNPRLSTSDLLHKHLRDTTSVWEHALVRAEAWSDKAALAKFSPPPGEAFFDRMLSPRFYEDLGLATSSRSKLTRARLKLLTTH